MMVCHFQIASCQTVGQRKAQEDACNYHAFRANNGGSKDQNSQSADRLIVALADGMGGHVGGARASSTACTTFLQQFVDHDDPSIVERFDHALEFSNNALAQEVAQNPDLKGMGCTLVGAYFDGGMMRWVSVGDSLLYRIHQGGIERLNQDHSMMPVLEKAMLNGEISQSEVHRHPQRNALRSALTGQVITFKDNHGNGVEADSGDCFILASDGLLTLPPARVAEVVAANAQRGPQAIAKSLVEMVVGAGRPDQDNTTVVVVQAIDEAAEAKTVLLGRSRRAGSGFDAKSARRTGMASMIFLLLGLGILGIAAGAFFGWPPDVWNPQGKIGAPPPSNGSTR